MATSSSDKLLDRIIPIKTTGDIVSRGMWHGQTVHASAISRLPTIPRIASRILTDILGGHLIIKESRQPVPSFTTGERDATIRNPAYLYPKFMLLSKVHWLLRTILRASIGEVLTPGWEKEPRFRKKCAECGKEYNHPEVEECEVCEGKEFDMPDVEQYKLFRELIGENRDSQSMLGEGRNFKEFLHSTLWYLISLDDFYWEIGHTESFNTNTKKVEKVPKTVSLLDAAITFPVMDSYGNFTSTEYFCPVCYKQIQIEKKHDDFVDLKNTFTQVAPTNPKCKKCGRDLIQTAYIQKVGGKIVTRFGKDEVIHASSSRVAPEAFGLSKIIAAVKLLYVIDYMDEYNLQIYSHGHATTIIGVEGADKAKVEELSQHVKTQMRSKTRRDARTGESEFSLEPVITFIGLEQGRKLIPVDIAPKLGDMQSIDYYRLYVEKICFTANTPIMTVNGWVPIKDIKRGDLVLTHLGNWKPVTDTMSRITDEGSVKITISGNYAQYRNYSIAPTPNHPILTQRGWVPAEALTMDDKISVIGSFCKICGKPTPLGNTYCPGNSPCRNYGRDYSANWKPLGEHARVTTMEREYVLKRDGYKCVVCDASVDPTILQNYKVHHIIPVSLGGEPSDPKNLATLCNNCHLREDVTIKLAIPRLKELGLLEKYNSVFEHGLYSQIYQPILHLERKQWNRNMKVYNISIEDDESYVAGGVMVHNCGLFGVTPTFVSISDPDSGGGTSRPQIDVQNRVTRQYMSDLEDPFNDLLLPRLGITDWVLRFGKVESRDELRDKKIIQTTAMAAALLLKEGFDVTLTEDGRNMTVSPKPVRPPQASSRLAAGKIPQDMDGATERTAPGGIGDGISEEEPEVENVG